MIVHALIQAVRLWRTYWPLRVHIHPIVPKYG